MKTIIKISIDYDGDASERERNDNIYNLVNDGMEVHCEISNHRMVNIVEDIKNYATNKGYFKNLTTVEAKGYSQSEWQTYKLWHNQPEGDNDLSLLVEELKKSFTHNNDYLVERFNRVEIEGRNFDASPHDHEYFCIRHIEFPEKEDVLNEYIAIFGEDYDEAIIDIN